MSVNVQTLPFLHDTSATFHPENARERQCLREYFECKSLKNPIVCGTVGKLASLTVALRFYYLKISNGTLKRGVNVKETQFGFHPMR